MIVPLESTDGSYHEEILDALPVLVLVVDDDVRVRYANAAAREALGDEAAEARGRRGGELLHCVHSFNDVGGCGRAEACRACVVRNSVAEAFQGIRSVRVQCHLTLVGPGDAKQDVHMLVTAARFPASPRDTVMLTLEDVSEVVALRGILPICSYCKRIRTEGSYWESVEKYVESHSDAQFTHSICETCLEANFPEVAEEMKLGRPRQAASSG